MSTASDAPYVLVTGGFGYIGSHTITVLLEHNFNVVVVDNFVNSSRASLDRVAEICQLSEENRKKRLVCYEVDLRDEAGLRKVFEESPKFASCIHFAGLKVRTWRTSYQSLYFSMCYVNRLTLFLRHYDRS